VIVPNLVAINVLRQSLQYPSPAVRMDFPQRLHAYVVLHRTLLRLLCVAAHPELQNRLRLVCCTFSLSLTKMVLPHSLQVVGFCIYRAMAAARSRIAVICPPSRCAMCSSSFMWVCYSEIHITSTCFQLHHPLHRRNHVRRRDRKLDFV